MAALSITPASVVAGGPIVTGNAGATLTAGQVVRKNTSDQWVAAVNDSAANAAAFGVALNGGAVNQPIAVQTSGPITIGATVGVGKVYVLGTAGGIIPVDDIAGTEFITNIGVGASASVLTLMIVPSGVAAAGAVT